MPHRCERHKIKGHWRVFRTRWQHVHLWLGMGAFNLLFGCVSGNSPRPTPDQCTTVKSLRLNVASHTAIDAVLQTKLSRRRQYDARAFCAYNEPTTNGRYYLLTIYDNVGNHRSETWVLLSPQQAVPTPLDVAQMAVDDSLKTDQKIRFALDQLRGVDKASRYELVQMLRQRAQRERLRERNRMR